MDSWSSLTLHVLMDSIDNKYGVIDLAIGLIAFGSSSMDTVSIIWTDGSLDNLLLDILECVFVLDMLLIL